MKYAFEGRLQPSAGAVHATRPVAPAVEPAASTAPAEPRPASDAASAGASTQPRPASDAAGAGTSSAQAAPTPTVAEWSALLPALESELAAELKTFRKSMKAARILPDFRNRDVFPPSKSGAWAIYHDERELPGGEIRCFTLYVRRTSDQLAVNEDGGYPYGISPNFTTAFPWALPTADAIRVALADRMRALGVRPQ